MKLFHCVVVMGAAITGGCGGVTTAGSHANRGDGTDARASAPTEPEAGETDNSAGFVAREPEAGAADDPSSLSFAQDASEAEANRASCCGDAGGDDAAVPCSDYSKYPPRQWACVSYDPPVGCTCNVVVAIL